MDILYPRCAGLDIHKGTVVASGITPDAAGKSRQQTRTFATMTTDLLALCDWLEAQGITHVAMQSTGEFWKPIYNLLEGHFELLAVNAKHVKNVPGRKTDVKDAQWIAPLLQVGSLKPSFVPPAGQREMRDLTRHRSTFLRERATLVNRVQKVLETANIKLACVASDVLGVSGRAMLEALIAGQSDPAVLAGLAKGRLRDKRAALEQALTGRLSDVHRFVLGELLSQIDSLDQSIGRFDEQIAKVMLPFEEAAARVDTVPGVAPSAAEVVLSEIGVDMGRFGSFGRLSAWAGVAPGNHESGGKRLSGRVRQGDQASRTVLIQCAHAAARTRGTYLSSLFHRLAARRGKQRAILAVAHSILVSIYHMLVRKEPYQDLGHDYLDRLRPEATTRRLVGRLETLGFEVALQPKLAAPA